MSGVGLNLDKTWTVFRLQLDFSHVSMVSFQNCIQRTSRLQWRLFLLHELPGWEADRTVLLFIRAFLMPLERYHAQRRNKVTMKTKADNAFGWVHDRMKAINKGKVLYTAFLVPVMMSVMPMEAYAADTIWQKASAIMQDV